MNSFHELTYMGTSCMLLKLKEEIDALCKTKVHIQDEMNKKRTLTIKLLSRWNSRHKFQLGTFTTFM